MSYVSKYKVKGYNWYNEEVIQCLLEKEPNETDLKSIMSKSGYAIEYFEISKTYKIVEDEQLKGKYNFTNDELIILKHIDKEWNYIARDKNNILFLYDYKPIKLEYSWSNNIIGSSFYLPIYDNIFEDIKWEDEEPIKIDDYVDRS